MAIIKTNYLVESIRGQVGHGLIMRTLRGKIVLSAKPDPITVQSPLQRENRQRFKLATAYAKAMMLDPEKKIFYQRKAKNLKLPNAYTAAITDYMRRPNIEADLNGYRGEANRTIRIKTGRKGFRVSTVKIIIKDYQGNVVEEGSALDKHNTESWTYKTVKDISREARLVMILAVRYADNIEIMELML